MLSFQVFKIPDNFRVTIVYRGDTFYRPSSMTDYVQDNVTNPYLWIEEILRGQCLMGKAVLARVPDKSEPKKFGVKFALIAWNKFILDKD